MVLYYHTRFFFSSFLHFHSVQDLFIFTVIFVGEFFTTFLSSYALVPVPSPLNPLFSTTPSAIPYNDTILSFVASSPFPDLSEFHLPPACSSCSFLFFAPPPFRCFAIGSLTDTMSQSALSRPRLHFGFRTLSLSPTSFSSIGGTVSVTCLVEVLLFARSFLFPPSPTFLSAIQFRC